MIIAFCGHANYQSTPEDRASVLEVIEKHTDGFPIEFFLGEYGNFDAFAYSCAKDFKQRHSDAKLIFITPYIPTETHKNITSKKDRFDLILYPPLENVPPKYAISHRNRWIVDKSNIIIAYVSHTYGGAYTMYQYAKKKNKIIYNLAVKNNS